MENKQQLPSDSDLMKSSHNLFYEIWMFYEAAKFLKYDTGMDVALTNVYLECFTLHGRVLLDFFYSKPQQDDVVAEHYITNWNEICPDMHDGLKKLSYRVGKEVAHLTYARLKVVPEAKGWDYVAIEQELQKIINKFFENVPKKLVVDKLFQLKPVDRKVTPVPTTSAIPFYATNTSTWVYKP